MVFCFCFQDPEVVIGTTQHSLKDSNVNTKVKTTEEKGVGVHSLAHNIS
jgi:hypothetical protein